jgi:SPP1 family predicted phage head-tail adaptor
VAVRIGAYRQRVTLQQPVTTRDAQNAPVVDWTTLATVWARVTPALGQEQVQTGAMTSRVRYEVALRFRSDVTAAMRVLWGTKILRIHGVIDPDARRERLMLDCSELT